MIKVYSTSGCPMCDMLKEELEKHNIQFENIMDLDTLKNSMILNKTRISKSIITANAKPILCNPKKIGVQAKLTIS